MISKQSAQLLLDMLHRVQLPGDHPNLLEAAREIDTARAELKGVLEADRDQGAQGVDDDESA